MAALAEGPSPATTRAFSLAVDGVEVDALHARPDDGVALGGVVLIPDIGGLRPLFEDLCRRIATHGLAVCAVEPFARIPKAEREAMSIEDRLGRVKDLYDDVLLRDVAEAADHLAAVDGIRTPAVMGFCIGGYYTFKAAATGRFEQAISFYGMVQTPENWRGPGHRSPVETLTQVCPTLFVVGTADPWVPPGDLDLLRDLWRDRRDCKVLTYPAADHGFVHDPDRPAHRPDDAADAWRHALAFMMEER